MRQSNTVKNFVTGIIPYVIISILGFARVDIFINSLGVEIYAVNQLFFQIFAYLSLVEAGVGSLITQQYYKFFANSDQDSINGVYRSSKSILKKVSIVILILGFITSFALKSLTNNSLSLIYMQFVFMLFLFRSVLEYLMFSPRFVLQADQKIYKINLKLNAYRILEIVAELILLSIGFDYVTILVSSIIVRFLSFYTTNKKVYQEYPWLNASSKTMPIPITGMKHIFYHKIAGSVYYNTDIILISAFLDPLKVTIYSSYNYIVKFISDFIFILSGSISASFGNVMYKESREEGNKIFEELNAIFFFSAMFFSVVLLHITNSFIVLWIGSDMLLTTYAFWFMILMLFHNIARRPLLLLRDTQALFKETQLIAMLEAIFNLGLSVFLVQSMGLTGVLLATVIATLTTNFWFYPRYMYKNVLNSSVLPYFIKYSLTLFISIGLVFLSDIVVGRLQLNNFIAWFIYAGLYSFAIGIILFTINYLIFSDFRRAINKIIPTLIKFANFNMFKRFTSIFVNFFFSLFPVKKTKIVFEGTNGKADGNPLAIYQHLKSHYPGKYQCIWILNKNANIEGLDSKDVVYYHTVSNFYHLSTAKYWIRSQSVGSIVKKKKTQVYIQTWHGGGAFKKCGYDSVEASERPPMEMVKEWDYFIASDSENAKMIQSSTGYDGKIVYLGMARSDEMYQNIDEDMKQRCKEIGITFEKPIVLYAPTFRDTKLHDPVISLPIEKVLRNENLQFVIRLHPVEQQRVDTKLFSNTNVINGATIPDIQVLLKIANIVITDYSSLIFDYALLNRPMIFYAYDMSEYVGERNGFYLDFNTELPGKIVKTEEELVDSLYHLEDELQTYVTKLHEFNQKYNTLNDGRATVRFVEMLVNGSFVSSSDELK